MIHAFLVTVCVLFRYSWDSIQHLQDLQILVVPSPNLSLHCLNPTPFCNLEFSEFLTPTPDLPYCSATYDSSGSTIQIVGHWLAHRPWYPNIGYDLIGSTIPTVGHWLTDRPFYSTIRLDWECHSNRRSPVGRPTVVASWYSTRPRLLHFSSKQAF